MHKNAHNTIVSLLTIGVALASGIARADEDLQLGTGEEQTVELNDLAAAVSIGKPGVVAVEKAGSKKTLVIRGRSAGQTNVEITLQNGEKTTFKVQVVGHAVSNTALLQQASAALNKINGVSANINGGKVYAKGKVRTHNDIAALATLKGQYASLIVDLTEKELIEGNTVVATINKVLVENGMPNIQARSYGKIITLEGSAKDDAQKALALKIATMMYPQVENNIDAKSNGAPSVSIEVIFIEVQKKDDKSFGMPGVLEGFGGEAGKNFTHGAITAGTGQIGGNVGRMSYAVGPLSSFMRLIQQKSVSRVLSNPKLVTRSGTKAEFHSGETAFLRGQKYDNATKENQVTVVTETITEVNLGIMLDILPKVDTLGQIDAEIGTEISEFGSQVVDGRQVVAGSKVRTAVTVKDGQSILLSGLVKKKDQKQVDRVPLLADIPIVGELFKSRSGKEEEIELLVLVTMNRVQGTNELIKATDRLWKKASDDVEFSIFD